MSDESTPNEGSSAGIDLPNEGFSVGIDLGTTNSLAARVVGKGAVEIVPNREGEALTPSVVSLPPKVAKAEPGKYLVGKQAVNNARRDPRNTIRSIKRFMGLAFSDPKVQVAKTHVTYEVLEDPGREGALVVRMGESLMTPEEVSAQVLHRIKRDCESRLGGPVTHAVITVPAYFLEPQRKATRQAGIVAGLNVKAILDEPTAAAISEFEPESVDRARILVFDFGGGTLDFSLVQLSGGNLNVLSYGGDNFLGGDDIDRGVAELIREWIIRNDGVIKSDDYRLEILLKENAETAKKTLSSGADFALVVIPAACRKKDNSILDVEIEITQEEFGGVLAPLENRVRDLLRKYFEIESLRPEDFTHVLMVGGSSAIPAFQKLLRAVFEADGNKRVQLSRNPMEAIARGAAIYGSMIKGIKCVCGEENPLDAKSCKKCGDTLQSGSYSFDTRAGGGTVSSRLPRSLGIRYRMGDDSDCYQPILRKGSTYPVPKPVEETFQLPSVERFAVHIFEGDESKASQNSQISMLQVDQIPSDVKVGDPLKVGFSYTRDRTLYITVSYPTSRSNYLGRWRLDQPSAPPPDDPLQSLTELLPKVRSFLTEYRDFMEEGVRLKLKEDLENAQTAITTGNREEAERLRTVMMGAMFDGCGIASTLFLAEMTVASDDRELGATIKGAANKLREQCQRGDPARENTRKGLDELIHQALSKRVRGPQADDLRDWAIPVR